MSLKVSNFDPAAPLSGAEIVGVVQAGLNKRTTVADVAAAASGQASDVTLSLASSLAAYPASNSASAINALIAALPRGGVVQYPEGHYLFDGRVDLGNRITARGQGPGVFGTDASATTLLEFPAGCTGFRVHHTGGKNSRIEAMRVIQTSLLATSQLGSYTAGATTITLNAAGDFQNGQVVQLDGAGEDVIIAGRLFTTTAGSAVVTWTERDGVYRGNAPGYNGMEIAIAGAGFAPGTTIVSWGIGTATLSGNAANGVSGVLATITTPLITEILSGGGSTTLTIADVPVSTKTVTNRKISHCAPAIYTSTQCHTRDFEGFGECQAGIVIAGITTGGAVADNGTHVNSYFAGTKFGAVLQGADAQVNSFYGCNFAGAEVGVLDQSFLGNYFYGCHWAFNMALLVVETGAQTQIIGGYLEFGSSWVVPLNGGCVFFGTVSMLPGYGLKGFGVATAAMIGPNTSFAGPISAKDDGNGLNYGGSFDGGLYAGGSRQAYFTGNVNGLPGGIGTNSGVAIGNSVGGGGGTNVIQSADNLSLGTYRELSISASQFRFGNSFLGSQFGTLNATAFDHPAAFRVNGSQVVGARGAAIAALAVTATTGSLPTADGSVTIANAATPTNAELLEYCRELESKLETFLSRARAATGHGFIS